MPSQETIASDGIEIIGKRESMAAGNLEDLVFAVAIEGSPPDERLSFRLTLLTLIKRDGVSFMADFQSSAVILKW